MKHRNVVLLLDIHYLSCCVIALWAQEEKSEFAAREQVVQDSADAASPNNQDPAVLQRRTLFRERDEL